MGKKKKKTPGFEEMSIVLEIPKDAISVTVKSTCYYMGVKVKVKKLLNPDDIAELRRDYVENADVNYKAEWFLEEEVGM